MSGRNRPCLLNLTTMLRSIGQPGRRSYATKDANQFLRTRYIVACMLPGPTRSNARRGAAPAGYIRVVFSRSGIVSRPAMVENEPTYCVSYSRLELCERSMG